MEDVQRILDLYQSILAELKVRLAAVLTATSGRLPVHPVIAYELCYLQLRMVCELIALSCLVVHRDIPGTNAGRIRKAWEPDVILNALEELHPSFYPRPGRQLEGGKKVEPIKSGFLTKPMLLSLYADCGNILHRGSIKKLGRELKAARSFDPILNWHRKIVTLLDHHQITLLDSEFEIWALMEASHDSQPHTFLMKRLGVGVGAQADSRDAGKASV